MSDGYDTRRSVLAGLMASACGLALSGCAGPASAPRDPRLPPASDDALRVATFNIRYLDLTERAVDGPLGMDAWQARWPLLRAALAEIDADLIAFQEVESWTGKPQGSPTVQRDWLTAHLAAYGVAAATGHGGRETGQPIFYRRARFGLLDEGCASLGDAPGLAGAVAGYPDRITWARLQDRRTGQRLTAINLHLHFSDHLRRQSGALGAIDIVETARARGDAVLVLGDFNEFADARALRLLQEEGLVLVPSSGASYHFNGGLHLYGAIDHVLHGEGLRAESEAQVYRAGQAGRYPSDHYPVWVDLAPS